MVQPFLRFLYLFIFHLALGLMTFMAGFMGKVWPGFFSPVYNIKHKQHLLERNCSHYRNRYLDVVSCYNTSSQLASILGMERHGGGGEKREKKRKFLEEITQQSQLPNYCCHSYHTSSSTNTISHTHTPLVNFGHLQFGITIWILFYFFEVPFFDFGNSKKGKIEF